MATSIPSSTLSLAQAAYRNNWHTSDYYHDRTATPDGKVVAEACYEGGSCLSSGSAWVSVHDEPNHECYRYQKKSDHHFSHPALTPDGSRVYVEDEHDGKHEVIELPARAGLLRRWRGARTVLDGGRVDGMTVTADRRLVYAQDQKLMALPLEHGFLSSPGAPTRLGALPEPVEHVASLADGSFLAFPREWERRCFVVDASGQTTRIGLQDLDAYRYRERVTENLDFVHGDGVARLVANPSRIATDEGDVKPHVAATDTATDRVAVIAQEAGGPHLWLWEPTSGQARDVAAVPIPHVRGTELRWLPGESHVLTLNGDATLVRVADGHCTTLPHVVDAATAGDGAHLAALPLQDQTLSLWSRDSDAITPVALGDNAAAHLDRGELLWTDDSRYAVACVRTRGLSVQDLHVIAADGTQHTVIPAVDAPRMEGNVLKFRVGDSDQQVVLPDGLATLEQQPWYVSADTRALLGGGTAGPNGKVERDKDKVRVGGVEVPVRKPDAAGPR